MAVKGREVHLPCLIFAKCRDRQAGPGHLPVFDDLAPFHADDPDIAAHVVGVKISAVELGQPLPTVNQPSGYRTPFALKILGHGVDEFLAAMKSRGMERMKPLAEVPAVVAAALDEVNFFIAILSDIAGPELAGLTIESQSPDVAQAISPDLAAGLLAASDEGIVLGNRVLLARILAIHVDTQDRTQECLEILTVAVGIVGRTAVPQADVEIPVGAELDAASIMVAVRLRNPHQHFLRASVGTVGIVRRDPKPRHDRRPRSRRIVDIQLTILGVLGMQREPQESFFVSLARDGFRNVQKDTRLLHVSPVLEDVNHPVLLQHEDPIGPVVGVCNFQRALKLQSGEDPLRFERHRIGRSHQPRCVDADRTHLGVVRLPRHGRAVERVRATASVPWEKHRYGNSYAYNQRTTREG